MVREGKFREDLFYRLNVISIDLPPLRSVRKTFRCWSNTSAQYSLENERQYRRITPEGLRPLVSYSWPGNVRELENVIERAVVLSSGTEIGVDLLPDQIAGRGTAFRWSSIVPTRRCSTFSKTANGGSSPTCSRSATGTRPKRRAFPVPLSTLNQKIKRLTIEIKKKGRE